MTKISDELSLLFAKYSTLVDTPQQKEIIERSFVYSDMDFSADLLICGINPSYRKGFTDAPYFNKYTFKNTQNDRYFKKFHALFEAFKPNFSIDYFDLFYQRHTNQSDINFFLKSNIGLNFLCDQLLLTQSKIERTKPKAIVVFNRFAANFWGINKREKDNKITNLWLGYSFERSSIEGLYKIIGFVNSKERINNKLTETNLKGCYVYFSRFLNHYVSREELNQIKSDIQFIKRLTS